MKKINITVLFKLILILSILLGLNILLFINIKIAPLKVKINQELVFKNYELEKKYDDLELKIKEVESNLLTINNYDHYINNKILGMDVDSSNFNFDFNNINNNNNINKEPLVFTNESTKLENEVFKISEITILTLNKVKNTVKTINKNADQLDSYPNISPILNINALNLTIGSKFGWRRHPIYHINLYHKGVDISANLNTDIVSTMNGVVTKVKHSKFGYGNHIIIENNYGYKTLYAHLNKTIVSKGDIIKKGEIIGQSGNSGLSTSPHLHYEVRVNNKPKDPENYIFSLYNFNYETFLAKK